MRRPASLLLLWALAGAAFGADDAYRAKLANPAQYKLAGSDEGLATRPHGKLLQRAARAGEVDPALLHAIVKVESGYNPRAVSPKGAVGLMQLMPETARRYGVRDSRDPAHNAAAGTAYLRDLLIRFDHDLPLALAAYNAGENAVLRHGQRIPPYRETREYVPRVLSLYEANRREAARGGPYRLVGDWSARLGAQESTVRE